MKYTDYQNNEKTIRSLTGLSCEQFVALLPYFEEAHDEYLTHYDMNGKFRNGQRGFTIYKNSPLPTIADRLFFILVYLKNNPLQEYHAACFEMDQKHCNSFIHVLHRILEQCLRNAEVMPAGTQKEFEALLKEEQREEEFPILLHDGTEREIPRPVDPDEQQEKYSGKKKKHTVKNAVVITACCLILYVSPTVCGKTHDKKIADTMYSFPYPCRLYQDTGYQGYNPEGVIIFQPIKKPRVSDLTEEEKAYNREISSFRVRVEHAIGSVKHMRIVKDECRLRADNFVQRIFKTCAAMHNFRIKINPWHYEN
jgi:flagellar biosynthesis chaperone FliJ